MTGQRQRWKVSFREMRSRGSGGDLRTAEGVASTLVCSELRTWAALQGGALGVRKLRHRGERRLARLPLL